MLYLPLDRSKCVNSAVYWDEMRNMLVKATMSKNSTGGFALVRVCTTCHKKTNGAPEEFCWKHGGAGKCGTKDCLHPANSKGLCHTCKVMNSPERACPRCQKRPACESHEHRLCYNCASHEDTVQRQEEADLARKEMSLHLKIPEAPKLPQDASVDTRYVYVNKKNRFHPYCVVRAGNKYKPACETVNCLNVAPIPDSFCFACLSLPRLSSLNVEILDA